MLCLYEQIPDDGKAYNAQGQIYSSKVSLKIYCGSAEYFAVAQLAQS